MQTLCQQPRNGPIIMSSPTAVRRASSVSSNNIVTKKQKLSPSAVAASAPVGGNGLVWFRSDLRTIDHHALHQASKECSTVFGLYIISPQEWKKHDLAPIRVEWMMRNLRSLQQSLQRIAIPLVVLNAKHGDDIPGLVSGLVEKLKINRVFWNKEYEVDEVRVSVYR